MNFKYRLIIIIKILLLYAPNFIKKLVANYNHKKLITKAKKNFKISISKESIENIFSSVQFDTDVFIHTSMTSIGNIEGGKDEVVRLFNKYILDKGNTMLFSALAIRGSSEDFLKKNKKFDIREQPIAMGAINSYYGKLKETKRSLSPTHSVIALGENAEYYVSEHHMSETPFTEKSPYFKLLLKKGKILMFGAGIGHLTFYHVLEDMLGDDFPVRVYTKERFEISVIDHKGDSKSGLFKAHNSLAGAYRITDYLNDKLLHLPSTVIISRPLKTF